VENVLAFAIVGGGLCDLRGGDGAEWVDDFGQRRFRRGTRLRQVLAAGLIMGCGGGQTDTAAVVVVAGELVVCCGD